MAKSRGSMKRRRNETEKIFAKGQCKTISKKKEGRKKRSCVSVFFKSVKKYSTALGEQGPLLRLPMLVEKG